MPPYLRREKHLLTIGILYLLDDRYASLPRPGRVLQLMVTNVRNRPLSGPSIASLRSTVLSLYHNLVTGSRDFPQIPYRGNFRSLEQTSPFETNMENSPLSSEPSGLMVPPAGSSSPPPTLLTPVLSETTNLGALHADRRNRIRPVECNGTTVTRVISPVYRTDRTQLTNRWRVTDYQADGRVQMSVLCRFDRDSARCAKKRTHSEEEGSSIPSPRKRLRV